MKRAILFLAFCTFAIAGNSQLKVTTDKNGNYVAVVDTARTPTGKNFIDAKGDSHPVYQNKNGRLFIIRISKTTGKRYNQYLAIKTD